MASWPPGAPPRVRGVTTLTEHVAYEDIITLPHAPGARWGRTTGRALQAPLGTTLIDGEGPVCPRELVSVLAAAEGCDPLVQRLQRRLERLHGGLVPGGERVIMRLEEVELPGRVLRPGLTPP